MPSVLKYLVPAAVVAIALSAASAAADGYTSLKDRAPSRFSWTGFYAGGHAGYALDADARATIAPSNAATQGFVGPAITSGELPARFEASDSAFLGGLQAGFNYQAGSIVAGVEADITWTDMSAGVAHNATSLTSSYRADLDWLATVRGRLGTLIAPNVLAYATAGLAVADIEQAMSTQAVFLPNALAGGRSETVYGWTVGGGLELVLDGDWTLKGEYLYVDFSPGGFTTSATAGNCSNVTNNCALNVDGDVSLHIARIGLNRHF